jgi:peptidylprolyl isomerase
MTGLIYRVLKPGTGDRRPSYGETVELDFAVWSRDGSRFDSTYDRGRPGEFTLDETQPLGVNEGIRMMVVGERRRFWIPEELAFLGKDDKPQGMVIFEAELLSIKEAE